MNLEQLDREASFALLAPGFFGDGQWRRFHPSAGGASTLWVARYDEVATAVRGELEVFRLELGEPPARSLDVRLAAATFERDVSRIREHIAAGDVYQVNLTVRAELTGVTGPELLRRLCHRGVPRFASWVRLPGVGEFVSASPELLVETADRWIHAEPMKGTAAPDQRAALEASEKDRAELAMITDLLRNDLHQLCERGSVSVTAARRFLQLPYVVQAVSDVEGRLREGLSLAQVFEIMHPGGSVTGAPRQAAMEVIRALEPSPRRFYCGLLGIEERDRSRTALLIRTATRLGEGVWEYGVGGGITWDSEPARELDEVRLKLRALEA